MAADKWIVLLGGIAAIVWVLWYFFLARRSAAKASRSGSGTQEITVTVRGGYDPARLEVEAGRPVRLWFDRQETSGCSEEVVDKQSDADHCGQDQHPAHQDRREAHLPFLLSNHWTRYRPAKSQELDFAYFLVQDCLDERPVAPSFPTSVVAHAPLVRSREIMRCRSGGVAAGV